MSLRNLSFLQKNLFFLVHLKKSLFGGFARKYYGQWGEDITLEKLFSRARVGFYVDVGAFHPMHYSNTYTLYKRGWHGVNIDANPQSIRLFNWYRPRDINVNIGIGTSKETKPYYIFNHQSCNTFSIQQRDEMLKKSFVRLVETANIACLPLQSVLDTHNVQAPIDLLNVDVEGMGLPVLASLNWDKAQPRVICVEDDELNLVNPGESRIHSFVLERGYVLHTRIGPTSIYCHESFIESV